MQEKRERPVLCLFSAADMKCFFPVLSCLAVLGKWICLSVRSMGKFNLLLVPVIPCGSFPSTLGFGGHQDTANVYHRLE